MIDEYVVEDDSGKRFIVNKGTSFIDACTESEEIEVFETENL